MHVLAVTSLPLIAPNDDIAQLITEALARESIALDDGDMIVCAQKIISKAENRYRRLNDVIPTDEAKHLARLANKPPELVQLILDESQEVVRVVQGVIVVRHRCGYVHANAGIDQSNIPQADDGNAQVLLLPEDSNASARQLRKQLHDKIQKNIGVIISDSAGRAWRMGITGFALGSAGFSALKDCVTEPDLFDRPLKVTTIAVADELAAAASHVMGQSSERVPVVVIKGANVSLHDNASSINVADNTADEGCDALIRSADQDLFL